MRSISEYWRLFWQNLTIEPVVFFYLMSVGLISVIRPTLLLDKACRIKLNFTEEICDDLEKYNKTEEVQKEVSAPQSGKTKNSLSLFSQKFRQINYLVISLVKPLLSQNFFEKRVRENFCNFHSHTVFSTLYDWN